MYIAYRSQLLQRKILSELKLKINLIDLNILFISILKHNQKVLYMQFHMKLCEGSLRQYQMIKDGQKKFQCLFFLSFFCARLCFQHVHDFCPETAQIHIKCKSSRAKQLSYYQFNELVLIFSSFLLFQPITMTLLLVQCAVVLTRLKMPEGCIS